MDTNDVRKEMQKRVDLLNEASRAYYKENRELMTNFEYDRLYDELEALEKAAGFSLASSPTHNVGYAVAEELPKERHPEKMLSLDKTKSVEELAAFLGDKEGLLSWKMDGLTIVLTFDGGRLVKAVTRGNGEIGEVVTANARTFVNVPVTIPFKGHLVVRGEAFITYSDFEEVNRRIPEASARYKNPRNLCSGSVRQLDSAVTADRKVHFNAFTLNSVQGEDAPVFTLRSQQMAWLAEQGFEVVYYKKVRAADIPAAVNWFAAAILTNDTPSDGLVITFDDIAYGRSLGVTAKFPRDSLAFKWQDETAETVLRRIEWSPSRTGLINPVAVFDPVELEGSTVSRASVHNLSVMKDLKLGIGDRISVYKANMIIPQIAEDITASGRIDVPQTCPACGGRVEVRRDVDTEELYCLNPACPAKRIKSFALFVSRQALDIEGLSESTLEKLIGRGFVRSYADLFRLDQHKEEIVTMEGLGEKSFANLQRSIDRARTTTCDRLLCGLGIPGIGTANARNISRFCGGRWDRICSLRTEELKEIEGVGEVLAESFTGWFADEQHRRQMEDLLPELTLTAPAETEEQILKGMTFVITGSLEHFANREQLKERLQALGARVSGSVSGRTDYLINNDIQAGSAKNKKAKAEGVPIISEEALLERFPAIKGEE